MTLQPSLKTGWGWGWGGVGQSSERFPGSTRELLGLFLCGHTLSPFLSCALNKPPLVHVAPALIPELVHIDLLSTKMEVRERGRQEGAYSPAGTRAHRRSIIGDFRVLGHCKFFCPQRSVKEPHMPAPDVSMHTSPHIQTHTHGGNKYVPYQSAPSLTFQVGPLRKGGLVSAQFFQGCGGRTGEGKGQTLLSPFPGLRQSWFRIGAFPPPCLR